MTTPGGTKRAPSIVEVAGICKLSRGSPHPLGAPTHSKSNRIGVHQPYYARILAGEPSKNLVIQPNNRGTAPAILYALLRIASVEVLALRPERLAVVKVTGVRWNDLGEPKRVMASLTMAGVRPHWVETVAPQLA